MNDPNTNDLPYRYDPQPEDDPQYQKALEYKRLQEAAEPRWRWHIYQDRSASYWNKRIYLHEKPYGNPKFKTELSLYRGLCLISFDVGCDEDDLSFSLAFFFFFWSISFNRLPIPKSWTHTLQTIDWSNRPCKPWWRPKGKETRFSYNTIDHSFNWKLWLPEHEWNSTTPKWRDGYFSPVDFIFGRQQYERTVLSTRNRVISMPEGSYPIEVTIARDTWHRPRAWWTRTVYRADIEVKSKNGIPNGRIKYGFEDATYGACFPLHEDGGLPEHPTLAAIAKFSGDILQTRREHHYEP